MSKDSSHPLPKNTFALYKKEKTGSYYEQKIIHRIDYIVRTIFKIFGGQFDDNDHWYFDYDTDDYIEKELSEDFISLVICTKNKEYSSQMNNMYILSHNDEELNLAGGFPTKWLYEDFYNEVYSGRINYIKNKADKKATAKAKREARKNRDAELLKRVVKLLTEEEMRAIRRAKPMDLWGKNG